MQLAADREASAESAPRAVLVPWLDALLVGGASLVVLPLLLLLTERPVKEVAGGTLVLLGVLFNWPHFVASYHLLYATRASIRGHRAASIYVPAFLAAYALFAVSISAAQPLFLNLLLITSGVYLARHYTGQAWGMMASYAHVGRTSFAPIERRLFRLDLDVVMLWHVIWALRQAARLLPPALAAQAIRLYSWSFPLLGLGFAIGVVALVHFVRRTGRLPPWRVLLPWVAVHVWYVAIARNFTALMAVQIAHALQYLAFPLRVTLNRAQSGPRVDWKRAGLLVGSWVLVGLAVFEGFEPLFKIGFDVAGGKGSLPATLSGTLIAAIAVHHYFIDGALYKLRNPEVRRDLFAHLPQAPRAAPAAQAPAGEALPGLTAAR
jgi:hypothetical protein